MFQNLSNYDVTLVNKNKKEIKDGIDKGSAKNKDEEKNIYLKIKGVHNSFFYSRLYNSVDNRQSLCGIKHKFDSHKNTW